MKTYDVVVIGGGGTGITAAFTAAGFGRKTLVVEKDRMGGECTWSGCIPSKALIEIAAKTRLSGGEGRNPDTLTLVRDVQQKVYEHESPEVLASRGIDYLQGEARFTGPDTLEVAGRTVRGRRYILATGSEPFVPPIRGIGDVPYLTNENLFTGDTLPGSLIILGGGPIGVELGQALRRLGTEVTIVEMMPRLLPRDDSDLAAKMTGILEAEGMTVATGTLATAVEKRGGGIALTVESDGAERVLQAEALLVAVGRRPRFGGLDPEAAGIKVEKGAPVVDANLRTTNPRVYAAGDVIGPYRFSHMAEYQGKTAAINAMLPFSRKARYDHVAWSTFTDPEMAQAGLTLEEARERHGDGLRVYDYPYEDLDRTRTHPGETGLARFVLDRKYRIVGASLLGPRAGELIGEIQVIKTLGIPLWKIADVIHPYPTYADLIRQVAKKVMVDRWMNMPPVRLIMALRRRLSRS